MLVEAFTLILRLPSLAFGPAMPPNAFGPPRVLLCDIHEPGRLQEPPTPRWPVTENPFLDPRTLRPAQEKFLVNRALDTILFLGVAYAGRANWEVRPWSDRVWQATGAAAPLLIPPLAPPPLTTDL